MMRQWILMIVAVLVSSAAYSQLRPVNGFIVNESKEPIADAIVKDLDSASNFVVSDSLGRFRLVTSAKRLEIKHISYKTLELTTNGFINGSRITLLDAYGTMLDQTIIGSDKVGRALKNQIVSVESVSPSLITDKNTVTVDEIV
ncbi:MAG: hypothetical protein ACI8SE_001437, partial [Bacteroidia bacterium]